MILNQRLLPAQKKFLTSEKQFALFLAGIGNGKSHVLRLYLLKRAFEADPRDLIILAANTYSQLQNTVLAPLFAFLDELNISYDYNKQSGILKLGPAKILCSSLENYNTLRGLEAGTIITDETAFMKAEALDVLLGRLRSRYTKDLQFRGVTSPNGYNRLYELFEGESKLPDSEIIHGITKENIFLPKNYVRSLYRSYTPKQIQQELLGQFTNLTAGAMYYCFDMDVHLSTQARYNPNLPLFIGQDYNVGLLCSIICQVKDGVLRVIDEICLPDSSTLEAAKAIRAKYGRHPGPITICPDATGSRRQTSASNSDHEILRRAGFLVDTNKANPRVEDRVNTVNLGFQNRETIINPSCKTLIKDLNTMTWNNKDPMLSHAGDAFGYVNYKLSPLIMKQKKSNTIVLD